VIKWVLVSPTCQDAVFLARVTHSNFLPGAQSVDTERDIVYCLWMVVFNLQLLLTTLQTKCVLFHKQTATFIHTFVSVKGLLQRAVVIPFYDERHTICRRERVFATIANAETYTHNEYSVSFHFPTSKAPTLRKYVKNGRRRQIQKIWCSILTVTTKMYAFVSNSLTDDKKVSCNRTKTNREKV
jgi:hypothetical protein